MEDNTGRGASTAYGLNSAGNGRDARKRGLRPHRATFPRAPAGCLFQDPSFSPFLPSSSFPPRLRISGAHSYTTPFLPSILTLLSLLFPSSLPLSSPLRPPPSHLIILRVAASWRTLT